MRNTKPKKTDQWQMQQFFDLEAEAIEFFHQLFPIEPENIRVHANGFYEAEYAPHHTIHGDLEWLQKRQGFELRFVDHADGSLRVFVRERRHMPLWKRLQYSVSDILG